MLQRLGRCRCRTCVVPEVVVARGGRRWPTPARPTVAMRRTTPPAASVETKSRRRGEPSRTGRDVARGRHRRVRSRAAGVAATANSGQRLRDFAESLCISAIASGSSSPGRTSIHAVGEHAVHQLAAGVGAHDGERPVVELADAAGGDVGVLGREVGAHLAALARPRVALLERHLVVVAVVHPDLEHALDVHLLDVGFLAGRTSPRTAPRRSRRRTSSSTAGRCSATRRRATLPALRCFITGGIDDWQLMPTSAIRSSSFSRSVYASVFAEYV